jgi:hypothetical protein
MNAREFLENLNPSEKAQPATPEQLEQEKQTRLANTIQIEFWMTEFTFTNCNDEPITGTINSQEHQTKLLKRAMERARDENKKLVMKNGMDTVKLEKVTDDDITLYIR